MNTQTLRPVDRYFANYSDDHRNVVNQRIHLVAVPAILWSVIAMLWCVPPLITWFQSGVWASLGMFTAWCYYNRLSRRLGYGMLAIFFTSACLCRWLEAEFGLRVLLTTGVGVFVVAWIAQFVGHHIEGRRPSFLTDLTYLLIGPLWVLAKFYRHQGWRW